MEASASAAPGGAGGPGKAAPRSGRDGQDLLGLGDRGLQGLLLLALALLIWSWSQLEGYQIADAVEYLERARELTTTRGEQQGQSIRAFGFSGLLIPFFAVANAVEAATGFEHDVLVVHAARVLQILMTLGLIAITARVGAALGGRGAGYAAAALLTASPTLLQWGVSPVSGIAAALLIALSIELLVVDDGKYTPRRRGWLAGLGLGGAFLMAYQAIMVVAPIFALILLRRRARPVIQRSMVLSGVATCLLTQMVLDYFYYGEFGKSVIYYLVLNFGTIVPVQVHALGELFHIEPLKDAARWIYTRAGETLGVVSSEQALLDSASAVHSKLPRNWYLVNLPSALTWPGVALLAIGIVFILYKRARMPLSLLVIAAFNVAMMSEKGSKEFRLWLPFLSMLAVLGGLGFRAFAGNSRPRLWIGVTALALAFVLGAREHSQRNRTRYGAFWRAMSHVNEEARLEPAGSAPVRAACTFHWGVLLREASPVELVKLPAHLDHWDSYDDQARRDTLAEIARLDWFIAHLPALTEHPEIMEAVARDFVVRASFFDRRDAGDFGPVLVLRRRSDQAPDGAPDGAPGELVLYRTRTGLDPAAWAAARGLRRPLQFGVQAQLTLLGTEFDWLPGDGHGWITYHWYGSRLDRDVTLVDRITCPGSPHAWHNNHLPAYGMRPTSSWPEGGAEAGPDGRPRPFAEGTRTGGWILSEGYLVVPEADPYRADGPDRFVGGAYMRGDLVPGDLWIDVATLKPNGRVQRRLQAVRPVDGAPVRSIAPPLAPATPDGWRTSQDGMTRVDGLLIPVTERQRARASAAEG